VGKDSGTASNQLLSDLCYESLLTRHSDTLRFMPRLATHWWISDDKLTFRYRINPRAHWSDGKPVIAADVVATWDFLMDPQILQPALQVVYGKFERPRAISKYMVEVRAKHLSWRNHLYFSTMPIFPAHEIEGLDGARFLAQHQFRMLTGSGPYVLRDADVNRGQHLTLRRRLDYWGWNERFATGMYNFDLIRLESTEDSVLALEKAKKGELDVFRVGKAKDWAVDLPRLEQVRRGLLVMCRVDNDEPLGVSGIVMNMRVPPLNDLRVRLALCHLYNRRKLIEKLFYDQYAPLNSYFPGGAYENPGNETLRYDPDKARQLLSQAGWTVRDSDGVLTQSGRRLELELTYASKVVERYLSVFQEDCLKAGVLIHLKQLTRATRFQMSYGNRGFQLSTQGWSGSIDPSPETIWFSELADQYNNNNLSGFKNSRVDQLCLQYDRMFDLHERIETIREIDGLIYEQHPAILGWTSPYVRLIYWNKFGHPPWYLGRTAGADSVLKTWWLDETKAQRLKQAKRDPSMMLQHGPMEVRYWKNPDHVPLFPPPLSADCSHAAGHLRHHFHDHALRSRRSRRAGDHGTAERGCRGGRSGCRIAI
jgi:microcin C transport system substrate-binding protein